MDRKFQLTIACAIDLPDHIYDVGVYQFRTVPNTFVALRIDGVSNMFKTNTAVKSTNPVWYNTTTLSGLSTCSIISIRVIHKRTLEHTIGSVDITVGRLLELKLATPESDIELNLQGKYKNAGSVFLEIASLDLLGAAKSAISTAATCETKVNTASRVLGAIESVSSGGHAFNSIATILDKIGVLAGFDKIDSLVQIVDELAKVHPYASLAWQILSAAHKVLKNQRKIDEKISELVQTMALLYSFVDRFADLRSHDGFAQHIERILYKTIECGYFLQSYAKHSLIGRCARQLTSNWDTKIEDFKTIFAQLHQNLATTATLETALATKRIEEAVNDLRHKQLNAHAEPCAADTSEHQARIRKSLLKTLKPSQIADHKYYPEGNQENLTHRAVCTPGTRVRLLDSISTWVNTTASNSSNVYWLFGPAGSGKSTIAYTVAGRFESSTGADDPVLLGGNFFCSRQFEETKQSKRIVRTIAYHLSLACKPFAKALFNSGKLDAVDHNVRSQMQGLLVEPWKASQGARVADPSSPSHYLIVIDALDEIEAFGGSKFLRDFFDVLNKSDLLGLKFFVTSRPDPDLVSVVDSFERKQLYRLQDVGQAEVGNDIKTYLAAELPHFAGREEIIKLVVLAAGLFIYAATVVRYLAEYRPSEQEELLTLLLSAPDSTALKRSDDDSPLLDDLYRQILVEAFRNINGGIRTRRLQILYTFLCTAERTSDMIVAKLLCTSHNLLCHSTLNDPYIQGAAAVLDGLHAVLYTDNNQVLLYHKSFTDFMFSPGRSQEFWCDQATQHRHLTVSCFRAMKIGLKFNIAGIVSSSILDCNNPSLTENVVKNIGDALRYACQHWSRHLCSTMLTIDDPLCRILLEFLQLRVLFWIEAMNLLGLRGLCDPMLRAAAKWVGKCDSALANNLAEAARFAAYFSGSPCSSSTPHLYVSALATWPTHSDLFEGWRAFFPRVPAVTSAVKRGSLLLMNLRVDHAVHAVAVSSDGSHIASGSGGNLVEVWDVSTGDMLNALEGHTDLVMSVGFSRDGTRIVSGSRDKSARIWEVSTGKILKELVGHTDWVTSATFSSDGYRVISGSLDWSVRMWDTSTGEELKLLEGHTHWVTSIAVSIDGHHMASGSTDKSVRLWDASTGEVLMVLRDHTDGVYSVAFSKDGERIVSGSRDQSVRIWEVLTGSVLMVLEGHAFPVNSVAFSNDGNRVASGSDDRSACMWDASTGAILKKLEGHAHYVTSVTFSIDDSRIISASLDKSVRIWDVLAGEELEVLSGHTQWVNSVALSSDGRRIVSGSADNSVRVWDASTGGELMVLDGHTQEVTMVTFYNDDNRIISGSEDKSVRLWDASTGKILRVLEGHTEYVSSVALPSDGSRIVSGSRDRSVRIWDATTGAALKVLIGHIHWVNRVAFSVDGSRIASASGDQSVRVWDASTGETIMVLEGHTHWVTCVAFSRDGNYIVSGSTDNSVRVWDAGTGKALRKLVGHADWVNFVTFSSEGTRIASGSTDKSVRLWDASTGEVIEVLDGHTQSVMSVAISSDDNRIVSGSFDKTVRVWDVTKRPHYLREYHESPEMHRTYTGWLRLQSGDGYLMFVPPNADLPDSSNILTIPSSASTSIDLTHAILGSGWHDCFSR